MSGEESIYIDCQPVNEIGKIEEKKGEVRATDEFLDDVSDGIGKSIILNDIGIQLVIGVTFFAVIYGLGQYVFKSLPKSMYEKKLNNM
tara:strand:+ start:113 stop:376 length:264 start_codon:yes stop_codon:yes gene_type:complete